MSDRYPKTTRITDLKVYPIKSCRGISVKSTILSRTGLKYDRCCMFIDAKNNFITIRDKPEMTLIRTSITTDDQDKPLLNITFPTITKDTSSSSTPVPNYEHATTISVPLEPDELYLSSNTSLISAEIWEFETDAYAFTVPEIADAVSNYFTSWGDDKSQHVQLVMKGPTPRPCGGNGSPEHLGRTEHVNFPDVLPVLVASETSLRELNTRILERASASTDEPKPPTPAPITIERFRPNIIVDSDNLTAWEEDEWKTLRFNPPKSWLGSVATLTGYGNESVDVDVVARCARCHVPNVDPDTAVKDRKEPWGTLYGYRRVDEGIKFKPCFGMLCCPRGEAPIEVGMEVEVREVMAAAGGKGEHRYVVGF